MRVVEVVRNRTAGQFDLLVSFFLVSAHEYSRMPVYMSTICTIVLLKVSMWCQPRV